MDNMKTPSSTGVIKITENSETALEDTETITSGSMITIASTDEKTIQDEQKDQDDQEEQNDKDDQGDQGDQEEHWVHGESPSELHLESVHSSMQSLMIEGTPKFMISMQSGTMITIDDQDDHGDQGDQGDHWVDGELWVIGDQKDQKDQEPELKKQKAKPIEYIFAISVSLICIIMPFTWYHLNREFKEDVILPYNEDENVIANYSCPVWDLVGDNYCDDEANTLDCGYDFNDCCKGLSDRSFCTDCFCYIPEDRKILLEKQFKMQCVSEIDINPPSRINKRILPSQQAADFLKEVVGLNGRSKYFGDGQCDLGFNNQEHFFDIGDCCLENPICISSTFVSPGKDPFCDEDICIKSNLFCVKEELGDGICQGHNNGPYCDHDLGDCCLPTESQTNFTCNSECFMDAYYQIPWIMGPNQPNMHQWANGSGHWLMG